ncbi:FAD-dependent monooxygenase [Mycobacterium sp. 3519A]|uniref:FAD-dependent monooxygenase n=1 Tax=Mycobacterium sp. 3519A TaxID=2057184 RepID=UPI000C7A10B2|nr:FAD-dependent monooxygenase [Mycobacterium sp. 3519A]
MIADTCDVIVVGAGPVGATAALLLASQGLSCIVIEAQQQAYSGPAVHVVSTRSMEIWREVGLEGDILALSKMMREKGGIPHCSALTGLEMEPAHPAELPDMHMGVGDFVSPTRAVHLPENLLSPLLWLHLRGNPRIDLRTGWKYLSHTDFTDGVTVSVADAATGTRDVIVANYIVATDGPSSSVRLALGVATHGPMLQHMVSVHFSGELEALPRAASGPVVWTRSANGVGALLIHGGPNDLVFQFPYFPPFESLDDFPPATCRDRILDAIGDRNIEVNVKAVESWTVQMQVATTYRIGRSFLAGEAAHRFPPDSALGLNTGIADVHNLAWKLAWVHTGRAGDDLLNTYERERHPVGVAMAAEAMESLDGMLEVVAVLGLPRRAARLLPRAVAALPTWLPQAPVRVVLHGLIRLAYQRFFLGISPGRVGRSARRRARAAITRQRSHHHTCGRDLRVRYTDGAVSSDGLPAARNDQHFCAPFSRSGGRLPHRWVSERGGRVSTLDLISRDELTLLMTSESAPVWCVAAEGLPFSPVAVAERDIFETGVPARRFDALVVRPDGHIVAALDSERHGAGSLRQALLVVGASSSAAGADATP